MTRRRRNPNEDTVLPDFGNFQVEKDEKGILLVTKNSLREVYYVVNPLEVPMKRFGGMRQEQLWAFQFGAVGATNLLIWARGIEAGLEEAGGWLSEHAPGHLTDLKEEFEDAKKEARAELGEDADEEEIEAKAQEIAETDMTYTESGWITSHEWWGGEASDELAEAGEYVSKALYAANYHNFDMRVTQPLGKGYAAPVELEDKDVLAMFADPDLGLTSDDVKRIYELEDEQSVDLGAFKIERVG